MRFINIECKILIILLASNLIFASCNNDKNDLSMAKKEAMDYFWY